MINLKILTGKPLKPGSFTERILGANIFSMLTLNTVNSWKHVVSIEEQMRPDIISDYYYNNPNYLDVLCIILEYLQYFVIFNENCLSICFISLTCFSLS